MFPTADLVTLGGYALGLWWARGGPAWAGLLSVVADELDGRLARAQGPTERGSVLDWGADVALTPLALDRLGRELGHNELVWWSPVVLAAQATARARGERPEVGSARAAIILAAIVVRDLRTNGKG